MSNITLEDAGARIYITGNTYALKNEIKNAGGHWDPDRKQWWIGKSKRSEIAAAIQEAQSPVADGERPKESVTDETQVKGKVTYKGKTYYLLASARDGSSHKICTLDASLVFWAKTENGAQITKRYGRERGFRGYSSQSRARQNEIEYPTLGSLRSFIERARKEEKDPNAERRQCWECGSSLTRTQVGKDGEWFAHNDGQGRPMCYCGC